MSTEIICPNCKQSFALEDAMTDEIKKDLRKEMVDYKNKKDEELKQLKEQLTRKDLEISQKITEATKLKEEELRKQVLKESGAQIKFLEEKAAMADHKVRKLEEKELEALRLQHEVAELK